MANRFSSGNSGSRAAQYAGLAIQLYGLKQNSDRIELQEKENALRSRFGEADQKEAARVNNLRYGAGGLEDRKLSQEDRSLSVSEDANRIKEKELDADIPISRQDFSPSHLMAHTMRLQEYNLDKVYGKSMDWMTKLADDPTITIGRAHDIIKSPKTWKWLREDMIGGLKKEIEKGAKEDPTFAESERYKMLIGEMDALSRDVNGDMVDTLFPGLMRERRAEKAELENKTKEAEAKLLKAQQPGKLYNTAEGGLLPADQAQGKHLVSKGMKVTTADGTTIETGVPQGQNAGMQKPTITAIEKDIHDSAKRYARVQSIKNSFQGKFQQLGTRLAVKFAKFKDFTGDITGLKLSGDEKKLIKEFSVFKQDAIENLNLYIKEITGAQMSEAEAQRLIKGMPNPGTGLFDGDTPEEFKGKMENTLRKLRLDQARYNYWRKNGFDAPSIIDKWAKKVEAEFTAQGLDKEAAQDRVAEMLDDRFDMPSIMANWAKMRENELIGQGIAQNKAEQTVKKELPQYFGVKVE